MHRVDDWENFVLILLDMASKTNTAEEIVLKNIRYN